MSNKKKCDLRWPEPDKASSATSLGKQRVDPVFLKSQGNLDWKRFNWVSSCSVLTKHFSKQKLMGGKCTLAHTHRHSCTYAITRHTHVHMLAQTFSLTHTHTHTRTFKQTHAHTCILRHKYTHTHTHTLCFPSFEDGDPLLSFIKASGCGHIMRYDPSWPSPACLFVYQTVRVKCFWYWSVHWSGDRSISYRLCYFITMPLCMSFTHW